MANPFTYIVNIKAANAEIEKLQAEAVTGAANFAAVSEQFDSGKIALAAKDEEISSLQTKLAEKVATDKAAFSAAVETASSAKALTITAGAGVPPLQTEPSSGTSSTSMTRTQFNALGNYDRAQFLRGGGKLSD